MALLTRHGKERVLAPLVRDALSARVEVVGDFDTDSLGTFTREVPRLGSQLDAARMKARLGIERSGLRLGLGSEGSFRPGPFGLGAVDVEVVLLLDADRGIEIVGRSAAPGRHVHGRVADFEALADLADRAGFPEHALVLGPDDEHDLRRIKGLRSWAELRAAFRTALAESSTGRVFAENDLRAHMHPTRMANIAVAGRDLVARVRCTCSACGAPGFGVVGIVRGLPCRDCGEPTDEARADEYACVACSRRELRERPAGTYADPARCPDCNP